MTTATQTQATQKAKTKAALADLQIYLEKLISLVSDSAGEALITLVVWAIVSAYIASIVPADLASRVIASMFMIYFVMFMIMLVRKFDSHWTVDELGDQFVDYQNDVNSRLDEIKQTVDDLTHDDVTVEVQ